MSNHNRLGPLLLGLTCLSCAALPIQLRAAPVPDSASSSSRWPDGTLKWTPENSAEFRRVGFFQASFGSLMPNATSPDGRHFYVLLSHGDTATDRRITHLKIYDAERVLAAVQKGSAADLRSVVDIEGSIGRKAPETYQPLTDVQWSEKSDAIYFMGIPTRSKDQRRQVWRVDIPSGKLTQVTHDDVLTGDIQGSFEYTIKGKLLTYAGGKSNALPSPTYPLMFAPRNELGEVALLEPRNSTTFPRIARFANGPAWKLFDYVGEDSLSADGSKGIGRLLDAASTIKPHRFAALDFARRQRRVLSVIDQQPNEFGLFLDGKGAAQLYWSEDSRHVLFVNVDAPVGIANDGKRHVLDYDFATGTLTDLATLGTPRKPLKDQYVYKTYPGIGWLVQGRELLLTPEATGEDKGRILKYNGKRWTSRDADPVLTIPPAKSDQIALRGGLKLEIREDRNTPPMIYAAASAKELALTPPDPKLAHVKIVPEEPFSWTMADGSTVTGGLTLPPDRTGERLPLIVQIGMYDLKTFKPNSGQGDFGPMTVLGHQPLVSRGFAVLNVDFMDLPGLYTGQEGANMVARIDAAVTSLARQGLVDPARVGLSGFSRSGFLSHYAVTHPASTKFAAAIAVDNTTFTFAYMARVSADSGNLATATSVRNTGGGRSFWEEPARWLAEDVFFASARSKTPLLLVDNGSSPEHREVAFDQKIGALQIARRPFEMAFFPDGGHNLTRPAELAALQRLAGEWFAFWLKGEEEADPAKAEQYRRWRQIRDTWKVQQAWEAKGNPVGSEPDATFIKSGAAAIK